MAKLNPLLLLGGAADALFVLSKGKKKIEKKANGDNKKNTEKTADAMTRLKKSINEGTMNPVSGKFKDALDYVRENYGQLAVQDAPPDIVSFNDTQLSGYIIDLQNKAFPNCQITMSEALSIMDKVGELGVQAMLGFTPREVFTIVFMNSAVNALMSEGLIDPEQPMFGQGFFN